ncbi:MAG: hypothetical protein KC933_03165, partial [Myxococcales bacterium]|nr:hypothetical protein [Myxococcales bacterium]
MTCGALAPVVAGALLAGCGLFTEETSVKEAVPTVAVVEAVPQGLVAETQPVRVRFSEPVVRPELVGRPVAAEDVLVVTPDLEGRGRWVAPDTFELFPGRQLAPNSRYSVRVRERTVGPGRRLVGARRFTFHTPLFRVISAQGHRQGATLRATVELSHPVRSDDAAGAVTFRDVDGRVLPARLLGSGEQRILRFTLPAASVDPDLGVDLRVEPTLTPRCGGAALDKAVVIRLPFEATVEPEVLFTEVVASDAGPAVRVRLNVDVDPVRARPFVIAGKPRQITLEPEHMGFRIVGLDPGTHQRVTLRAGMPTLAGPLVDEYEVELDLPHISPRLSFTAQDGLLSSVGGNLAFTAVNVGRVHVRAIRVPDRNVAHVDLHGQRSLSSLGQVVGELDMDGTRRDDSPARLEIPVQDILRGGRGLYRVEVEDAERAWVRADGWLLQNGLLLTAKVGADYVRAKVEASDSGRPVGGALVTAYSRTGRRIFGQASNAAGLVEHRGGLEPEDPVAWLVAEHGASAAYLPMAESLVPMADGTEAARGPAFVMLDRDYYRPGEALEVRAFFERGLTLGGVKADLVGPNGPVTEVGPVTFSPRGFLELQANLPIDAPTGAYTLRLLEASGAVAGSAPLWVVSPDPEPLDVTVRSEGAVEPGRPTPFVVAVRSRF